MADFPAPAPTPYPSNENENANILSINEEKLNDNNNDYPENIETNNGNNNISQNITSANPVTYRSKWNKECFLLITIIVFLIIGIGSSIFCFIHDEIVVGIISHVFTAIALWLIFLLECTSMTIDPNRGEIYIKKSKIYKCQKNTYKIDDVAEINIRESQIIKTNKERFYDIVLVFNDGTNIFAIYRSDKDYDSVNVCNNLRNILPSRIQIINNMMQSQPLIEN